MNIATTLTKVSRVKGAFRIWPAFYNFGLNSPLVVSTSTWQTRTTMEFLASSPTRTNHCQSFFIPESRNDIVHSNDQFSLVTSKPIMPNIFGKNNDSVRLDSKNRWFIGQVMIWNPIQITTLYHEATSERSRDFTVTKIPSWNPVLAEKRQGSESVWLSAAKRDYQ